MGIKDISWEKKKLGIHNIFLTADLFSSTDWNIWNKIIVSRLEKKNNLRSQNVNLWRKPSIVF